MTSVAETMSAHAAEAMKLTRKHFVVELDFSETSVQQMEHVMADVEFAYPGGKSSENVEMFARLWGAYLGETIRRNCGGEWLAAEDDAAPVLKMNDTIVSPHDVVRRCLTDGSPAELSRFYEQVRG